MVLQWQVFSRGWQRFLCLDWHCTGGAAGPLPFLLSQHYLFTGEVHFVDWTLCFIIHFTDNMRGIGHSSLFAIYAVELGTVHAMPTRPMVGVPCPAGPPAPAPGAPFTSLFRQKIHVCAGLATCYYPAVATDCGVCFVGQNGMNWVLIH